METPEMSHRRVSASTSTPAFTQGSVGRHILRLSSYMAMGFLAMTATQLVEAIYLGILGTAELAAVAFTFPLVMVLNAAARGVGVGASSVIARVIGAGERSQAAAIASHCLILVAAFAAVCTAAGLWGIVHVLRVLGAADAPLSLAVDYMNIWFLGFVPFALSMVGTNLLRAGGSAAMPGIVMTVGSLLQMALGPFLIFGWFGLPALGIEGAAWAFVLARIVSFVLCMYWLAMQAKMLSARVAGLLSSWRRILHVGVPATATNMIGPLSTAILTRLLADQGAGVVAGFGVASRVDAMMAMIIIAVASSAAPFIGQNWGARAFERVHATLRICYAFCLGWGALTFAFMWLAGEWLVGLINDDPAVVAAATWYLVIIPPSLGFMGVMAVASSSFNALGKPVPPLILSIVRLTVVLIPLAVVLGARYGHVGIFVALALSNVLVGIAAWMWNARMIASEIMRVSAGAPAAAVQQRHSRVQRFD
jgi:putative MATE family efflux protein